MNTNINTPTPANARTVIESNHMGGKWIDRLYQLGVTDAVELINKDSSKYKGRVFRRRISRQNAEGQNFFASAYESADGRWFDNSGMPIEKPFTFTEEYNNDHS